MDEWILDYTDYTPQEEPLREALCALGNGFFVTRGACSMVPAGGGHYPGTYLAGGYNRLTTNVRDHCVENEDLVNMPNWLLTRIRIDDGDWFGCDDTGLLSYRQRLFIRQGLLQRETRFRDPQGRITALRERRIVHMSQPHLAALEITAVAENWSGRLEISSGIDGGVVNDGVARYRGLSNRHLETVECREISPDTIFLQSQTSQSRLRVAMCARTRLFKAGRQFEARYATTVGRDRIDQACSVDLVEGESVTVEKAVALYCSRDRAVSECGLEACSLITRAAGFDELLERHAQAWEHLWRRFIIELDCDNMSNGPRSKMILHLYMFHLLQTSSMHTIDLDVGVPSRGWHGEAYRGHIFWDELFIFPLLNFRVPEITRALLRYRYRRLDAARKAAREEGFRGAMFPWQSGSDGGEESQKLHLNPRSGRWIPDNSRLQRHVNAAIAYNICQYVKATGDMEFLSFYGAEILLEIARFWASASSYNSDLERYEIRGVMGPDEYHEAYPGAERPGLDNNSYTNLMAVWVLTQAMEMLEMLPEERRAELCETIKLHKDELQCWRKISRRMRIVFHDDGIISQFEGYDRLEEFDWDRYRERYGDIQRLDRILEAEDDHPNRYKASKQADVLMLFYLFSSEELGRLFRQLDYDFSPDIIPATINYYLQRTSHGSTLSRVVHSWVLARSDRVRSWELFSKALESDISDIQGGTTPEGIHLGAMAGCVDILQNGYTGIKMRNGVLWFNPCLPERLSCLRMQLRYRGHALDIDITCDTLKIHALKTAQGPVVLGHGDRVYELEAGHDLQLKLQQ